MLEGRRLFFNSLSSADQLKSRHPLLGPFQIESFFNFFCEDLIRIQWQQRPALTLCR